eukprot:351487-Chlamydomonas_euryale.AAC.11
MDLRRRRRWQRAACSVEAQCGGVRSALLAATLPPFAQWRVDGCSTRALAAVAHAHMEEGHANLLAEHMHVLGQKAKHVHARARTCTGTCGVHGRRVACGVCRAFRSERWQVGSRWLSWRHMRLHRAAHISAQPAPLSLFLQQVEREGGGDGGEEAKRAPSPRPSGLQHCAPPCSMPPPSSSLPVSQPQSSDQRQARPLPRQQTQRTTRCRETQPAPRASGACSSALTCRPSLSTGSSRLG